MTETETNGKADPAMDMKRSDLVIEARKEQLDDPEGAMSRSPSIGRIKAPPVCNNATLKTESMSSEDLSKLCFPQCDNTDSTTVSTSSACSISSRESRESDHQSQLNAKVMTQKSSRQGRETQRWVTDPATHQRIRLVTGCVPILKDGRILFVSSSRKAEWILPKGGWELDETMEESAVRESYEEAGVLGTLGTRLSEVQYETRKSRKRRWELEEMLKRQKDPESGFSSGASDGTSEEEASAEKASRREDSAEAPVPAVTVLHAEDGFAKVQMSDDVVNTIRSSGNNMSYDETSSVASDASSNYSLVRMTLFPLYVTEVKGDWPESGLFRKAVDID